MFVEGKDVSRIPPKAAQENAKRGLELRKKWGRGGLSVTEARDEGIDSGVTRANQIVSGNALSRATIAKMSAFARHERNYKPNDREADGGPTAGTIAWLLWGGTEGIEWAQRTLKQLDNEKAGNQMYISKKELFLGDYVKWNSSNGQAYGRIERRVTDGSLPIPQTDFVLEGSDENPAYLIRLYKPNEDGTYEASNVVIGHREASLERAPNPENMKDIDIDIEQTEVGNEEEYEDDEDDEDDDEGEDQDEGEEVDDTEEDDEDDNDTYEDDRQTQEELTEPEEMSSAIDPGNYVRFEASGNTYRGRVIKIASEGNLVSSSGYKVDGSADDPAVLIRLYRQNEDGTYEESDMKVVHRMSSLVKIPSLSCNYFPKPGKSMKITGQRESKVFAFNIQETKEIEIDGEKYGVVRGYASTYGNVDRGNDKVMPGAFQKSLQRYIESKRPIKMYFNHNSNEIIGGFPVEKMKDDPNGLYVEGQINLGVQKGREAYALAKQGVMQDFSIGYTVDDYDMKNGIRELKQLELWEISMVGEPMNPEARIITVKSATPYQDLPMADESRAWDNNAAIQRIRKFTDSMDAPSASYKRAFMWFDAASPENFSSYKLPYADVVDGKLVAVPKAIYAIAAALRGARGGVDIPEADKAKVIANVNKYYAKMDKESPFKTGGKQFQYDDVVCLKDKRDFERLLRDSGVFSRKAATYLSSLIQIKQRDSVTEIELNEIKNLLNYLQNRG